MSELLIVEDDPSLRLLYQEEFREEGYKVYVASSGEEAIRQFRSHPVDGIVLDIRLGGMDGLEVLRNLLEHKADLAVVLNSAYTTYKSDFTSWSADRFVVKSSDISELKTAVSEALLRRAAQYRPTDGARAAKTA